MSVILLTNHYGRKPREILKKVVPKGFELITLKKSTKTELLNEAHKANYFLVSGRLPIDEEVLNKAVNLKMIQRTGVGTDMLDEKVIRQKNIPVYVNHGVNARSVAEHTIMLMLSVLRQLPTAHATVKSGKWKRHELGLKSNELCKKNIGLVGLGNIGLNVVKMLQPFDVKIFYFKPSRLSIKQENLLNITYCELHELLKKVDILSLHCPLNSETQELIGKDEIAMVKRGAVIINTARGGLINEDALVEALQTGHLKGAGIDVYKTEPLQGVTQLTALNNVVLTPHQGGITAEAFQRMMQEAMENIRLFEKGLFKQIEQNKIKI